MLNEWLEYKEYTCDLQEISTKEEMTGRLKCVPLNYSLSGVQRAMIVIGRRFLYDDGKESYDKFSPLSVEESRSLPTEEIDCLSSEGFSSLSEEDQIKRIECTRKALQYWCGDVPEPSDQGSDMSGLLMERNRLLNWFPNYLEALHTNGSMSDKKYWKAKTTLKKRIGGGRGDKNKQTYSAPIFVNESSDENDFKLTTYDRVIARALRQGPLREYYLVAGGKWAKDRFLTSTGTREDSRANGEDLLLKMTAAYLIEDARHRCRTESDNNDHVSGGGQQEDSADQTGRRHGYLKINNMDIVNWSIRKGKIEGDNLKSLRFRGEPVFDKLVFNNVAKIRPHIPGMGKSEEAENPAPGKNKPKGERLDFIDYYGWHLTPAAAAAEEWKEHPERIFYKDSGSDRPLQRIDCF